MTTKVHQTAELVTGTVTVDSAPQPTPPTSGAAGQQTVTTSGTSQQLNSGTSSPCNAITIRADIDNAGYILVAFSTGSHTANGFKLYAGQSVTFAISNVNKVWLDASANGLKASWIAT